jgi:hypothetical protein
MFIKINGDAIPPQLAKIFNRGRVEVTALSPGCDLFVAQGAATRKICAATEAKKSLFKPVNI